MKKLLAIIILVILLVGCEKPKTDYFDLVTVSEIVASPRYYSDSRVQVAGFAHYEKGLLVSLSLYEDKKQINNTTELNHLIVQVNDDLDSLLSCNGKGVLISGVIEPNPDFGVFIQIEKDIKVIGKDGNVNEVCYKLEKE